jgi:LacI family transcriptional regulator
MTIKDIARRAGVSIATVSYVLNGKNKVSINTRNKILKIIAEVGYQLNGAARDLKTNNTNIIAVCLENLRGRFFSELIAGMEQAANELNYTFIVATSHGNQVSSASKILTERRADGAIILAPTLSDDFLISIADNGLPLVLLDRDLPHVHINSILLDNFTGVEQVIAHLAAKKIRTIGFIGGVNNHFDSCQRLKAFYHSMDKYGIEVCADWIYQGKFRQECGVAVARQLLAQSAGLKHGVTRVSLLPQVMICANDEMAIGFQQTMLENNIQIPQQISVIGFDDIELGRYVKPTLSTISHPKYELGYMAFTKIINLLNRQIQKNILIKTSFIHRESSL